MAKTDILTTYGVNDIREDVVLNAVEILTARESQMTSMVQRATAIQTVHSYLTDTLLTPGSLAVAEQDDYTAKTLTTPSRLTNIVEIIAKNFKVSRTQQQVQHHHGENELQRQTRKALWDWANAFEFDFVRSTLTSGASGTAPKMSGIIEAASLSKNHTSQTSTTVWAASILDGLMQENWDNSNGDVATDLFMGSHLRAVTDGFTQKSNVVVNNPGGLTRIVRTVTSYETAFGTLNIHKHRYIQQSADAHDRVMAIRPDKLAVAWLQMPFVDTGLARLGDYDNRAVVGKPTLEVRNQESCWFADGYKQT